MFTGSQSRPLQGQKKGRSSVWC